MSDDLSGWVHGLAGHVGVLDALMKGAAEYLVFAVVAVLIGLWFHEDGVRTGLAVVLGALAAVAIGTLIAGVWNEPRPFVAGHFLPLISHSADASFPSDHLLALGAVSGALWARARPLAVLTALLSLIVAYARVYVGVHYAGDVLAGFGIGLLCGVLAWLALG